MFFDSMQRRRFLSQCKRLILTGIATLLYPTRSNPNGLVNPFYPADFVVLFQTLYAGQSISDTEAIKLSLPDIAENGAVVPITISTELAQISGFDIWVEKNPTPLLAKIHFESGVLAFMTGRIKMAESCHVIVIAHQEQRLLRAQQWVTVIRGGCGTG